MKLSFNTLLFVTIATTSTMTETVEAGRMQMMNKKGSKSSNSKFSCDSFPKYLTEPFDTDVFSGSDENMPRSGDMWSWAGNRLCPGLDNYNCHPSEAVGVANGRSTYFNNEGTADYEDFWEINGYGLLLSSGFPLTPETTDSDAGVTGGTNCFMHASGIVGSKLIVDGNVTYWNYYLDHVYV